LKKVLFHLCLNLTQSYQTSGSWAFLIIAISLKFKFASMCLGKNYMMPFFASGHAIAWAKQAELVLKKFFFD